MIASKLGRTLLCATSVVALTVGAKAQDTSGTVETVVVTGSRVISDAANSPTPLTIVTTAQLQATTPTDVPDALNKLPIFQSSNSPRTPSAASSNTTGNVLNLRGFGAQRTLILLDGHRVAPSNQTGTVDVDTLPEMLMSRVDVVTGGASAVYGSDAVTGVVNFVLDKHFNGLKIDANAGISEYGDGATYSLGGAAGTDLFGGHGHFEISAKHFHSDRIKTLARKEGQIQYELTGSGTAANPYVTISNPTLSMYTAGGHISCTGCAANNEVFTSDGVIGPYYLGVPTGTSGFYSGGDGARVTQGDLQVELKTDELFSRFSYDLDDTTTAYVNLTASSAINNGAFYTTYLKEGNIPNTFFTNNPYLTPQAQALLANPTGQFQLYKFFTDQGPNGAFQTNSVDTNLAVSAGADGTVFGKYDWDVFYTHGQSLLRVADPHNEENNRVYASLDAVTNSAGNIVCYVSTTPYAYLYPGCVPTNPFGPTATTTQAWDYFTQNSHFVVTQIMDDVGGSITGDVFDLPAGPIKAALSGEMRWLDYSVISNAHTTDPLSCLGLRICSTSTPLWQNNISNDTPEVSSNVWEFAAEANIPLLKDLPVVQSLSTDIAGRYTDYSTSGAAETWKIGLDWHVNDDVRFRATNSIDIRAPTLNDLYGPLQSTRSGYVDFHTGNTTGNVQVVSSGNPNLVPEVARTYTAGVVLTPDFIPGFTTSVDVYDITLKNAIGSIAGTAQATQVACEVSGGTSPLCALYDRPFPFSNTTPQNYPTNVHSESLNAAFTHLQGLDVEINYSFELADVVQEARGSMTLRILGNLQPVNESLAYSTAPLSLVAESKGHITAFAAYSLGDWTFNVENRWLSHFNKASSLTQVYVQPQAPERDYVDLTIDRKFTVDDNALDAYLSIQNLLDQTIPIIPTDTSAPGNTFAGITGANATAYSAVGRYFTLGIHARL